MKVLFFSHQADFIYGGEVVTLEFMRELKARGVDVHFASPPGTYFERAREIAICHPVPSRQFSRTLTQLPGTLISLAATQRELGRIISREGISLLHATSLKAMAFAWPLGGRLPVIWHHHDILPPSAANSLWVKGLASRSRLILVPSQATKDSLVAAGVSAAKAQVLHNGFRLADWKARPPSKPGHLFRVGIVGEISHRKGSDRLEKILQELLPNPDIQVLVIGEGLSEPEFAENLRKKLASRQVRFLGRRTRMKELYSEMDMLLVPSRQDPLPTVIVEAGLSGLPVVGARVGGIPEMVIDGRNGFLFDTEAEAASAIRKVRVEWSRLAAEARLMAEKNFDIIKLTDQLLGLYGKAEGS